MLNRFGEFVLKNRVQAMATVFICSLIPFIGPASVIIAAFATLCNGALYGTYLLIAASLPFFLGYLFSGAQQLDFVFYSIVVVFISNILTFIFALIIRRYHSWSLTLQIAGLLCVGTIIIVHLLVPDINVWWKVHLTQTISQTVDTMSSNIKDTLGSSFPLSDVVDAVAPYATGFIAALIIFYSLLQTLIARSWQASIYKPGALKPELINIRLSQVSTAIFIATFACAFFSTNSVFIDIMPVFYFVFGMAGLSLIHYLTQDIKLRKIILGVLYFIISMFPQILVLLAGLAVADVAFDFRSKVSKPI